MTEAVLQMRTNNVIPRYALHKPYKIRLPNISEWNNGIRGLIRYTDGSKTKENTGAWVCGNGRGNSFDVSLWYTLGRI